MNNAEVSGFEDCTEFKGTKGAQLTDGLTNGKTEKFSPVIRKSVNIGWGGNTTEIGTVTVHGPDGLTTSERRDIEIAVNRILSVISDCAVRIILPWCSKENEC